MSRPAKELKIVMAALLAVFTKSGVFDVEEAEDAEDEEAPKPRRRRASKSPSTDNSAALKKVAAKYEEAFSKGDLKEVMLEVAGVSNILKVPKAKINSLIKELQKELDESEEEDEDEGEEENEVTVEAVKIAYQAFQKKNGSEEASELLEEVGIKSVRSLSKLDQDALEDLYAAVMAG